MEKTKTSRKAISVILTLAMILGVLSAGFVGGITADAASTVTLSPVPVGSYTFGAWLDGPNAKTFQSFEGDKNYGPGTYYYAVATAACWHMGDNWPVIIIKVDNNLNVTVKEGVYGGAWDNKTVSETGGTTVDSRTSNGITYFGWGSLSSGKVYRGAGVSDSTLAQWAVMKQNSTKSQLMSANSVEALTKALGAPARTVSITNPTTVTINGGSYKQMSVNSQEYVDYYYGEIKPVKEYEYDEYFLNDHYLQGVWDAMPAQYGWQQDQWTEPGKFSRLMYSQINNKSYAISLGGQNPWILNDYFERTPSTGWTYGYDEIQKVPYLWHRDTGSFISYENLESLKERTDYINKEGLGGVIIWEMSGDDTKNYPMTTLLKEELKDKGKMVVGYFTNWSVYNDYHQKQTPTELPWDLMTHINYSFYQVGGSYEHELPAPAHSLNSMDRYADDYSEVAPDDATAKNMLHSAKAAKLEYPDTKLLVSVGGWTRGDGFYEMVKSDANIDTFVNSVKAFLDKYPFFDGVDLDWEYPGKVRQPDFDDPADRGSMGGDVDFSQYVKLLQKLRTYLDTRGSERNVLTACVPAAPGNIDKQDILSVANYCTFINVMTYDYHGAFDPVGEKYDANGNTTGEYWELGYNAPLYGRTTDYNDWSTANTVSFLKSKGIPASKMNIGTPYYSRGWSGVPETTITDKNGVEQPIPAGIIDPTPFDYDMPIVTDPEDPKDPEDPDPEYTGMVLRGLSSQAYVNEAMTTIKDELGNTLVTELHPRGQGGRTFLPVRFVGEMFGCEISWIEATSKVKVKAKDFTLFFQIDNMKYEKYWADGTFAGIQTIAADQKPPTLINGRTYLPVRALGSAFGYGIEYLDEFVDSATGMYVGYITITDDPNATLEYHQNLLKKAKPLFN